ncbi:response regulator transcription factor [Bacillus swezeyi]|uniref:Two-component system response regulator n=1 Tax=Bacillus swezeyi TaxID=1925020 RepID=A0A1R1S1B6_9BACI|nr:response regulator transcription factor [Bacillus swezeyi]MEC1259169.1 response regulator transcription factor [Bacillus swezeyi]MED1740494.1 response regulator transcription factor [Bacillus swezeyi]MED2927870.1 response regulator transcription factor [Bacillus swezeyi]MED2942131.1 response regulator transcription factor [Bacillus swezeyi]MED2965218.1 response regulator transcription factor [Bacillus swezeyi]
MVRVLLVDDYRVMTSGMKEILKKYNMDVIVCHKGNEALDLLKNSRQSIDIFLYDLNMPQMNGLELSLKTLEIVPQAKIIIMFSGDEIQAYFNKLIEAGVKGFIDKSYTDSMIVSSIILCLKGAVLFPDTLLKKLRLDSELSVDEHLTNTELDILQQVAAGKTNKEIAANLQMSTRNVEYHLSKIYKKLKVTSRYSAVKKGKMLNLIKQKV